ncbi:hypothetical protein [Helicobacter trogontum]
MIREIAQNFQTIHTSTKSNRVKHSIHQTLNLTTNYTLNSKKPT